MLAMSWSLVRVVVVKRCAWHLAGIAAGIMSQITGNGRGSRCAYKPACWQALRDASLVRSGRTDGRRTRLLDLYGGWVELSLRPAAVASLSEGVSADLVQACVLDLSRAGVALYVLLAGSLAAC